MINAFNLSVSEALNKVHTKSLQREEQKVQTIANNGKICANDKKEFYIDMDEINFAKQFDFQNCGELNVYVRDENLEKIRNDQDLRELLETIQPGFFWKYQNVQSEPDMNSIVTTVIKAFEQSILDTDEFALFSQNLRGKKSKLFIKKWETDKKEHYGIYPMEGIWNQ